MDQIMAFIMLGVFGYMGYLIVRPPKKNYRLLKEVARAHGGKIVDDDLVLEIDGITVTVVSREHSDINDRKPGSTHWHAKVPPPGTPSFKIYPEGFASFAKKAVGVHEVELGFSVFDNNFMVVTDDESALRRLWTRDRCGAMLKYPDGMARGDGDTIEVTFPHELNTIDEVMHGVALVAGLAGEDIYGLGVLAALPDAVRKAGAVEIQGPGEIRIVLVRTASGVVTRATAIAEVDSERALPAAIGPATLARNGTEITITWPAIEQDPARLTAAIELLRSFVAEPTQGVFR